MADNTKTTLGLAADPAGIAAAAAILRRGGLVAFPTETVYGLGADARAVDAVAGIYAAKGRPRFNPLIAHLTTLEAARAEARFSPEAERLAAAFWPGPLTLVLPRAPGGTVCDLACAGLGSVGLRVPSHPAAQALLRAVGRPVAAPSANPSGRLSPTRAADVLRELGAAVDLVLDGGACPVGVESTILGCPGDGTAVLLRPGGIASDAVEAVLGRPLAGSGHGVVVAPGMLASHYAPRAALRLDARAAEPDEVGLDFAGQLGGGALDLSPTGDLAEAAANLYSHLRRVDASGARQIAVAPVPAGGLGAAINDRLHRAAAPRPAAVRD